MARKPHDSRTELTAFILLQRRSHKMPGYLSAYPFSHRLASIVLRSHQESFFIQWATVNTELMTAGKTEKRCVSGAQP